MAIGPGQELAEQLLARLSPQEYDIMDCWSSRLSGGRDREFITGFLAGIFMYEYSMVALSNAARALADGEVEGFALEQD